MHSSGALPSCPSFGEIGLHGISSMRTWALLTIFHFWGLRLYGFRARIEPKLGQVLCGSSPVTLLRMRVPGASRSEP